MNNVLLTAAVHDKRSSSYSWSYTSSRFPIGLVTTYAKPKTAFTTAIEAVAVPYLEEMLMYHSRDESGNLWRRPVEKYWVPQAEEQMDQSKRYCEAFIEHLQTSASGDSV
ncbi:hypothetical protein N7G274_009511 [Stereocaulon virgatum]|uniref:Uncharacterized protein n=1 Tax=Stereocaulon virgatum TaxID=373712 RepID=A0ABR3ZYG3_9LECA